MWLHSLDSQSLNFVNGGHRANSVPGSNFFFFDVIELLFLLRNMLRVE